MANQSTGMRVVAAEHVEINDLDQRTPYGVAGPFWLRRIQRALDRGQAKVVSGLGGWGPYTHTVTLRGGASFHARLEATG